MTVEQKVRSAALATGGRSSKRGVSTSRGRSYPFLIPLVAFLGVFVYGPIARLLYYSGTEYDGLGDPVWVGMGNFEFLLVWPDFVRSIINTGLLASGLVLWVALPFTIAVIVSGRRGANVFRAILLLPALLPPLIVGRAFRLVLAEQGPMNEWLRAAGLEVLAQPWIASETWVIPSLIGVIAWATVGVGVLLYSAGLTALSKDYVDAALVDGARWHQLVWHIYRPALRQVTRFWTLLLMIGTVTSFFPWIFGLTQGGPGVASTTLDYQVYRSGLQTSRLGLASAVALVGVFVVLVMLGSQFVVRRWRKAESW